MHVRRTPVMALEEKAFGIDARIFFKLECLQHTGSFKPRGAFNCILNSNIGQAGVIAASGGNHGAAVAYAAHKLGHRAEIFVPVITPKNKVDRLRLYDAAITITGNSYSEALAASRERAEQTGAVSIHAYDDARVLAGPGDAGHGTGRTSARPGFCAHRRGWRRTDWWRGRMVPGACARNRRGTGARAYVAQIARGRSGD